MKRISKQQFYLPALVIAGGLFAYAAYMGAPREAFTRSSDFVASATVGASAAVEPNEYNTLAQQLGEKQNELSLRERELIARENELTKKNAGPATLMPLISFIISLVLAFLIALNFYMDWRRGKIVISGSLLQPVINLKRRG